MKEREDKERAFRGLLNAAAIEQLSEPDFRGIIVFTMGLCGLD